MKAAEVRYYVDADALGLAKVIARLRPDTTYPGDRGATIHKRTRPACPVTSPNVRDREWIPLVAQRGWLVITRDTNISTHRAEVAAVRESGARLVAVSGREATTTWHQLEIVMTRWRAIEELAELPGPFIYTATRTSLRKLNLDLA